MKVRVWAVLAIVAIAALVWFVRPGGDERAIRRRLDALVEEFNESTGEGVARVTRAARLGTFFTGDVVVDLGRGTAPISGRDALIGTAASLQGSTTPLVVGLEDVAVARRKGTNTADVALTATVTGRDARTGEPTIDAREFALELRKESGEWKIARATAVDTLK